MLMDFASRKRQTARSMQIPRRGGLNLARNNWADETLLIARRVATGHNGEDGRG